MGDVNLPIIPYTRDETAGLTYANLLLTQQSQSLIGKADFVVRIR